MGDQKNKLDFQVTAYNDYAITIPAGIWHIVTNTGRITLNYTLYMPFLSMKRKPLPCLLKDKSV